MGRGGTKGNIFTFHYVSEERQRYLLHSVSLHMYWERGGFFMIALQVLSEGKYILRDWRGVIWFIGFTKSRGTYDFQVVILSKLPSCPSPFPVRFPTLNLSMAEGSRFTKSKVTSCWLRVYGLPIPGSKHSFYHMLWIPLKSRELPFSAHVCVPHICIVILTCWLVGTGASIVGGLITQSMC